MSIFAPPLLIKKFGAWVLFYDQRRQKFPQRKGGRISEIGTTHCCCALYVEIHVFQSESRKNNERRFGIKMHPVRD